MKQFSFLLVILLLVTSCAKNVVPKTEEKSTKDYTLSRAIDAYSNRTIDFETFSAKVKCRFEDEKRNMTVKTTIRIKKDEKIWMSAGLLGFEGVRALVTPDSVFVINRLEKKYYEESIEELQTISGLPVDFTMLQNLLTGKLLIENGESATITQKDGLYELISELGQISSLAWLDDANFELVRQTMIEQAEDRQMEIGYHNYKQLGAGWFPYESNVHVTGEDELWLDFDYSDIKLNDDLSFPYTVNQNYKKGEL